MWVPPPILEHGEAKSLTAQGKATMVELGKRFRLRFNDFIPSQLDSKTKVKFRFIIGKVFYTFDVNLMIAA